jgi:hypothetical protein
MPDNFTWIPFYEEAAKKLVAWEERQPELIAFLDGLSGKNLPATKLQDKDEQGRSFLIQEIDPFTFFGAFNRTITNVNRIAIAEAVKGFLGVEADTPKDFDGIPTLNPQSSWFISYKTHRQTQDVPILWQVFKGALGQNPLSDPTFTQAFNAAQNIRGVYINLTMGLYWIQPKRFLALDRNNCQSLGIELPSDGLTVEAYAAILSRFKGRSFIDLSHEAWKAANAASKNAPAKGGDDGDVTGNEEILSHFDTQQKFKTVRITWSAQDTELFCRLARAVNGAGLDWWHVGNREQVRFGRKDTGAERADIVLGIMRGVRSRRVSWRAKLGDLEQMKKQPLTEELVANISNVLAHEAEYLNGQHHRDRPGFWPDQLRADPESTAEPDDEDERPMSPAPIHPLNQILFGPPGTGKTWATARIAVEICNGQVPIDRGELMALYKDLVKEGRIAFTTFHQSIGYEEFVEGLRPVTDSEDGDERSSAGFHLEARNGIFRDICDLAERARKRPGRPSQFDFAGRQFFKMSLGRARTESHIYDAAIEDNYIALGWGGDVDWSDSKYNDYDAVFARWQEKKPGTSGNSGNISQMWRFRTSMKKGDIVIVSDGNFRFRAIGEVTGDYQFKLRDEGYNHRRPVKWLAVLEKSLPIETIYDGQLSQASCYLLNSKRVKLEALAEQIRTEPTDAESPAEFFVLIIDEINRANVSKVLGELITLLEPDKRLGETNALTVKLPYSLEEFGVPNNLHVIGTMNTADRSIALLDTALRRRFDFVEMMPDYECLNREVSGIHLGRLLSGINRRVEWLFDRDHQIGHSFFTSVEDKSALDKVMRSKIIPLLGEYFHDDWQKVRVSLNDTGSWFVGVEMLPAPQLLREEGQESSRYSIKQGPIPAEAYAAASDVA